MRQDLPQYAIRLSARALDDIDIARQYQAFHAGEEVAPAWLNGLRQACSMLAASPFRTLTPENARFQSGIRQILYRRSKQSSAYRVFFKIVENGIDAPFVFTITVCHASQAPLTLDEARQIEEGS